VSKSRKQGKSRAKAEAKAKAKAGSIKWGERATGIGIGISKPGPANWIIIPPSRANRLMKPKHFYLFIHFFRFTRSLSLWVLVCTVGREMHISESIWAYTQRHISAYSENHFYIYKFNNCLKDYLNIVRKSLVSLKKIILWFQYTYILKNY